MNAPLLHDGFADPVALDSKSAIAAWRGECLNIYARAEQAVVKTLRLAPGTGHDVHIKHLGGQRLAEMRKLADAVGGTAKQRVAIEAALDTWQEAEDRRRFLAHGVCSVWLNERHEWLAVFDMVTAKGRTLLEERWAVRSEEAEAYRARLHDAFQVLSRELGGLCKRMCPDGGAKAKLPTGDNAQQGDKGDTVSPTLSKQKPSSSSRLPA